MTCVGDFFINFEITTMKLTITKEKFEKAKEYMNGICFWREAEDKIEVKIPKCFLKYYQSQLLTYLKSS